MATVADIVTGILVTELAADDDMTMLAMTDSRNLLIRRYLQQRMRQKKRVLQQFAHAVIRKKKSPTAAVAKRRRKRRGGGNRDHDYLNNTVPWFCDDEFTEFRNHFKMERSTFDKIVVYVSPKLGNQDKCTLPVERKILVALWLLSSQESFRNIGEKFGLQKSTSYYAFVQFVCALSRAAREFIFWPDTESLRVIASEFERHFTLPGVIGVVHTCHIPVKISSAMAETTADVSAEDRAAEPYSTMQLQVVCDSRFKFLDVHVAGPQPIHSPVCNWTFFEESELGRELCTGEGPRDVPADCHVLADAGYPLRPFLLTPYPEEVAAQSEAAKNFNATHRATRHVVHRGLAMLRGRFSRLKYVDTTREDLVPQIVMAACVLHNMIVEDEDCDPDVAATATTDQDLNDDTPTCLRLEHHIDDEVLKRDEIANRLFI